MDFEEDLPSYATALSQKRIIPWAVLAPHLPYEDYPALSRVDRAASQVFTRLVWQQPDKFFSAPHRSHVQGFFDFFDTVAPNPNQSMDTRSSIRRNQDKWGVSVRAHVRNYVSVIDLRFISGGVYADPGKRWLLTVLDAFPSLKVLRLDRRKFVDSAALSILASSFEERGNEAPYKLQLLSLAGCSNITPQALSSVFGPGTRFKALRILDLSYLRIFPGSGGVGATLATSLDGRSALPLVKVVYLRGCRIDESTLAILAKGWGRGVESWDLAENPKIGSEGVKTLLEYCVSPPAYSAGSHVPPPYQGANEIGDVLKANDDGKFDSLSVFSRRLLPANATAGGKSQEGITRLRIQGTKITLSDAADLLLTTRFTHLDLGYFPTGIGPGAGKNGLDEIAQLLSDRSFPCALRYLRIDYRLIVSTFKIGGSGAVGRSIWIPPSLRVLVLTGIPQWPVLPAVSAAYGQLKGWREVLRELAFALRKSQVTTLTCEVSNASPPPSPKLSHHHASPTSPQRKDSFGDRDAAKFRKSMAKDFSFFDHDDEDPSLSSATDESQESGESARSGDERDGFLYNLREWRRQDQGTEREWLGTVEILGPAVR